MMLKSNENKAADRRADVVNRLRFFNKRVTNRLTMKFAGKRIYAVLHHQGRKSGKAFKTPVVAVPVEDGFIIPLPYGDKVDWCRNILAAGECQMQLHGRMYHLKSPQFIEPAVALPAFPGWVQYLLRDTTQYLKMECASGPDLPDDQSIRKILVYGAGVLGSLYAGKLHRAGYDVTLLARGQRLEELKSSGLILMEDGSQRKEMIPVRITDHLAPEDAYDLIVVIVRNNQLDSVLPVLAANSATPNVLFMVNNAAGPDALVAALGKERVLLGFPGAGGQRVDGVVRYRLTRRIVQPTTLGELDGSLSKRILQIARALDEAGFPTAVERQMDAWLKTHVAVVSPVANALYMAGGDNYRLARTRDGLILMVRAVKESLHVLRALQVPITPPKFRLLAWIPEPLLVAVMRIGFNTPQAELVLARHANAARDEMRAVADEFQVLARRFGQPTPAINALYAYIDPNTPIAPEGEARLKMDWRSTIAGLGVLVSLGALIVWMSGRKKK